MVLESTNSDPKASHVILNSPSIPNQPPLHCYQHPLSWIRLFLLPWLALSRRFDGAENTSLNSASGRQRETRLVSRRVEKQWREGESEEEVDVGRGGQRFYLSSMKTPLPLAILSSDPPRCTHHPVPQTLVHTSSPFISIPVTLLPHMFSSEQWIECHPLLPFFSSLIIISLPLLPDSFFNPSSHTFPCAS